ncbi:hypothetical protein QJS83_02805 [Bdellovibrio sp. 22V]|uniref:hypothetical protein n=1 Tax=Bdellovibrio sp. 22V TaxID=3044166 RepID=UPI002543A145|nr:hypothetical protein [Bdellovibrio sp. 22V]WII72797.1 hypothetical protein QJS83_02805 [Bdellovibrio sp. 22V]
MKSLMTFLLVVAPAMAFSQNVDFRVQKEAYVIHGTSTSCMAYRDGSHRKDIAAPYIDIPDMTIANRSGSPFIPGLLSLRFTSSVGSYECTYVDYELESLGLPLKMKNNEILDLGCPMKCGGLRIGNREIVEATVELLGYVDAPEGVLPVKLQKKMKIIETREYPALLAPGVSL